MHQVCQLDTITFSWNDYTSMIKTDCKLRVSHATQIENMSKFIALRVLSGHGKYTRCSSAKGLQKDDCIIFLGVDDVMRWWFMKMVYDKV